MNMASLLTIVLMALATYMTRVLGYVALRNRTLGPRATMTMEAAPGCVLVAVIAPHFVAGDPAELLALVVTVAAATRLPMLPTVAMGIGAAFLLRHLLV